MSKHTLLIAALALAGLAAPGVAHAETKLTATVFTASPGGFLVNSTLVAGDKEAVLIDAQFSLADAHRLIATLLESKKTLTTVYITHGHPDHYFGLAAIQQAFPKAKLVAAPAAVAEIKKTWQAKVKQWGPMYGALVPQQPVLPTALAGKSITLEGQTLEIHGPAQGDSSDNSYIWIPSIKTVIAGDVVYANVHVWTRDTNAEQRKAWIKTLDEIAALGATTVIAGHKDPKVKDDPSAVKATRDYLEAFDAAVASSKTAAEVQQKIKAKYGAYQLDIILQLAADAVFPAPLATPAKKS
ncbi:MAG TPA: MBL fold metallo-hydrolase [Kofleriaceae bacterium]|nr:MBL fold metallo-hydrolase [Kofleriaceae bacterium]